MKKMAASFFKVHCLAVMDEVQAKRETVVISKHGKPVAKLPIDKNTDDIYGFLKGKDAKCLGRATRPRSFVRVSRAGENAREAGGPS